MIERHKSKDGVIVRKVCNGLERYFSGKYRESEMTRLGKKTVQRVPVYSYMGSEMTLCEFSEKYHMRYYTVMNWMKAGKELGKKPERNLVEHDGQLISLDSVAKELQTSVSHLRYNLSKGYDLRKPHRTHSLLDREGKPRNYRLMEIADEYCKRNGVEKDHGVMAMMSQRIRTGKYATIDELTSARKRI